jgi:alpha-2-macroglobulin
MNRVVAALSLILLAGSAGAANGLRVVSAGPAGETATLAEASEIRVVFSEPMVALGRVPQPVTVPFFTIEPRVKGTFRWSGTTTLIFTPDEPLPFGTEYAVTIDRTAAAVSGRTLDQSYRWTFSTPAIRLLSTEWYRRDNGAVVIALRFNQPVDAATLLPRLQLRTQSHTIAIPPIPEAGAARLARSEPGALEAFEAKRAAATAVAAAGGQPVFVFAATEWNTERFPPSPDLVVLETKPGVPPDTWMQVLIDETLAEAPSNGRRNGRAPARQNGRRGPQSFTIELEPTFFVAGVDCVAACDPEYRNSIQFRTTSGVRFANARRAVRVTDITDPANEVALQPKSVTPQYDFPAWGYSLDELGYSVLPGRRYLVRVDGSIQSEDGQKLGHTWMAVIENWHKSAFVSFGGGHGVWETSGGSILPFHARNFRSVREWLAPMSIEQVMPAMVRLRDAGDSLAPDVPPRTRTLELPRDKTTPIGLDLRPAIGEDNRGLAWAAVQPGQPAPRSRIYDPRIVSSLIQATNLGISVKDSPLNTIVMVTRLDDARPVAGASVSIRDRSNAVVWRGTTGADGIAVAPDTDLRRRKEKKDDDEWSGNWYALEELHFIVTAEKDGDVAYVASNWNEGLSPWELGVNFNIAEADPQFRGTIFADRGVYKPGEEVHFKLIVRSDTPKGMRLLPAGTKVETILRDSHSNEIDKRLVELNAWSSAEWTLRIPAGAPLGSWGITATVTGADEAAPTRGTIRSEILVAAYRRPDFRVDTTLTSASTLAGTQLNGKIVGRYLFGGPMSEQSVKWTYSKIERFDVPQRITDRWPSERYAFLGYDWSARRQRGTITIAQNEEVLNAGGELALTLDTDKHGGVPYEYRLEGNVTDVTRQQIAGRASFRVDPAPWYIGLRRPPYFADAATEIATDVVAVGREGLAVAGVPVQVRLQRLQWTSVRQAEGSGFYGWQSERKEVPAGEWTITTDTQPVPLQIPLGEGGEYLLTATASDGEGRSTTTRVFFYAVGEGYTAWERHDHNRIELVPEKTTYRPGETARIMVKSPWESATALLTTEREGVRTWTPFELTSTQETITVPISEAEIPNVYVSVLLVKGRTLQDPGPDGSDPGKPAFRLGYVELKVEDASKRLNVDVRANRDEFRPAAKASIEVDVRDAAGRPAQSEVTLWAVDYGVLSLTAYQTPDVLGSIYLDKALQVANQDSRQKIVSRRVLTPKGASDGGGGGRDAGPGTLRSDFRVLAFWVGSLVTDAAGRARTEIALPESLTTYRIMAVAGDRESRFGWDQAEIRINKPLMLTPAWPRFLAVGDRAHFGAAVHNQLTRSGRATVTIESLDPHILEITGGTGRNASRLASQTVQLRPGSTTEVRFDVAALAAGEARVRMRVTMGRESDAFEDVIPVRVLVSPETVAAYGVANPQATETLRMPESVVPGFGGLRIDLASTAMVGLAEGARYLIEYPYGCAEQRASRTLGLMLAADLGSAFSLPGIDAAKEKETVRLSLLELARFQCGDGGFSFWPGQCDETSPYLTSYIVHVFQRAVKLGYAVDDGMMARALTYLDGRLSEPPPVNEGWRPAYNAWQAFSIKALVEGGRNADSHLNRVYEYRDRMPVFALSFLLDALTAKGETGSVRALELRRRIMNSILPEGGQAHVGELNDPYLLWFWSSNVRSTAIVLATLVRGGQDEEMATRMVRWLMVVRKNGRWGNTQENAWALESLVDYLHRYESEVPDFTATVAIGDEVVRRERFSGRESEARSTTMPMTEVARRLTPQAESTAALPMVFTREGAGTLHYMLRLRYAVNVTHHDALDHGFHVERSYAIQDADPATSFRAGDLIAVTLRIRNTKERRFVAITDPLPAGTEAVETWFATTATELTERQRSNERVSRWAWWERGGFDHVERHDDRVNVFATRLGEGTHEFTYLVRATTAGTFITAPAHAEEMYEPEVFGRTATARIEVAK